MSDGGITAITDRLIPELRQWQKCPPDTVYPFVWLDAVHCKIKDGGHYVNKAVHTVLGLNADGYKELPGLYLSEREGARHWPEVLADLHNRGIKDILIACIDGLTGFDEAISNTFPQTEVQLCIIHQIRNSLRHVASRDQNTFGADLKPVYRAADRDAADEPADKWGGKYSKVIQSWRIKWSLCSACFRYQEAVRKPIYATNAVEAVPRQFRKLTKTKGAFPNEAALLKLLYVGITKAPEKWTMPIPNWGQTRSRPAVCFEGRPDDVIKL